MRSNPEFDSMMRASAERRTTKANDENLSSIREHSAFVRQVRSILEKEISAEAKIAALEALTEPLK